MAGNASFGKKQASASTRTTGKANNAYGKARSAAAKSKKGSTVTIQKTTRARKAK